MKRRLHRGFTLVEVLVALAVLAIALTAVLRTMGQAIDVTATLREQSLALWLAQNRLAEHQMRRDWPAPDTKDGDAEFGGVKWFWREQVSTTPEPKMRRIEITVRRGADSQNTQAKLVGYLLNPSVTTQTGPSLTTPTGPSATTPAGT